MAIISRSKKGCVCAQLIVGDCGAPARARAMQQDPRQRVQHPDQPCIIKRYWPLIVGNNDRRFAWRQELKRARDTAAEAIKKGEIIGARYAKRLSGTVALAFLRQEACKKRPAFTASERRRPLGQGGGQGLRRLVAQPFQRIGEA